MIVLMPTRINLKGAAKRSAVRADATRYLRTIVAQQWANHENVKNGIGLAY